MWNIDQNLDFRGLSTAPELDFRRKIKKAVPAGIVIAVGATYPASFLREQTKPTTAA